MNKSSKMNVFEYLNLRSEYEDIIHHMQVSKNYKNGTLASMKWFSKNGKQKNRFRDGFERAIEICDEVMANV